MDIVGLLIGFFSLLMTLLKFYDVYQIKKTKELELQELDDALVNRDPTDLNLLLDRRLRQAKSRNAARLGHTDGHTTGLP